MKLRVILALVAAAFIGAFVGDSAHPRAAQAVAVSVSVQCNTVTLGSTGRFVFTCTNAPADSSGIVVNMTIDAPTQRYPLGVPATLTLP